MNIMIWKHKNYDMPLPQQIVNLIQLLLLVFVLRLPQSHAIVPEGTNLFIDIFFVPYFAGSLVTSIFLTTVFGFARHYFILLINIFMHSIWLCTTLFYFIN